MKKSLLILGLIIIGLAGWLIFGGDGQSVSEETGADDKLVALSTFTVIADMVAEVGGDRVESISLTKPGAEIHGYETTPSDLVQASQADVFFENGMNLELWAEQLRASLPDMPAYVLSDGVEVANIAEGDYEGKPNPHAWMSPEQGKRYIENIRQALVEQAPEHAEYFNTNASNYTERLTAVDNRLRESLSTIPDNNRFLVTCEGAFTYLANDYDLEEVYLWAINDESGGSPRDVANVINVVQENQIPTVFCESTVEPRLQMEVVQATGAELGAPLYVDSLSPADGPAPNYLGLIEHTADAIIEGLTDN
jgi:manganese transport system substrate-binding protein